MAKLFIHFLIAVLGYYLSGRLGLMLAIPPGFASAVWPASGVALACLFLLQRTPAAIGIGFGSFLLNLGVVTQNFADISLAVTLPVTVIAMGAIVQALAGYFLFRQLIGVTSLIEAPRDIVRFVLFVGPVGCVVAASIGVTTLYANGIIALENYGFTWLTWWIGDTIGVLLFTPLLLIVFSYHKRLSIDRKVQIALPTLIIFSGVLALFFTSTDSRHQAIENEVEENARRFFLLIEERLKISTNKLRAYVAFYRGSAHVTQEEFDAFSKILLDQDSSFQGVGWTEVVAAENRQRYEMQFRAGGFPDFTFTELAANGELIAAPLRDEYYPVLYIYPYAENKRAHGLNLAANAERRQALMQARALAIPVATAPVQLVQETGELKALIMYLPIFNAEYDQTQSREDYVHDHFQGYISGVFLVRGILGAVLQQADLRNFGISIHDVTDSGNPIPLVLSQQQPLEQFDPVSKQIQFGGRTLDISVFANTEYRVASKDWTSWTILTSGFLMAAMLQSFILMLTGTTESTRQQVRRKTRALSEAKQMAEEASIAKSNFLANMSHEFRTPLNAIVGLVNLCLKTPLSEKQSDYLQKAKLASNTLLQLINHTLDYSKIEAGKLELERITFQLPHLLQKIQAIFSSQAIQQGIEFEVKLPPSLPTGLIGDPLRLEQVLLNLCSNAFKFTEVGKVQLIVGIAAQTDRHITLDFTVTDTGIGMSDAQQKQLFQSFRQADNSMTRRFGGTGLGLAISKEFVSLMGGTITVSSVERQGSRFSVRIEFPLSEDSDEIKRDSIKASFGTALTEQKREDLVVTPHTVTGPTPPPETIEKEKPLTGVTVLVVEDIKVNQLIAQEILEELGASTAIAENGLEALQMLEREGAFDIVLMDIQMPEMDGYEATRKIRKDSRFADLPVVAMTANAMVSDIEQCKAAGMNDHIAKPIDEDELLRKVLAYSRPI